MFNEQIRPAAFYLRRLGVAQKKHYFCLRLALKIVLRRKKNVLSFHGKKNTWKLFLLPVSPALDPYTADEKSPGFQTSRPPS